MDWVFRQRRGWGPRALILGELGISHRQQVHRSPRLLTVSSDCNTSRALRALEQQMNKVRVACTLEFLNTEVK